MMRTNVYFRIRARIAALLLFGLSAHAGVRAALPITTLQQKADLIVVAAVCVPGRR